MTTHEWPLGDYIRKHRGKMSKREAARRAGISETWWRRAESGTQSVAGQEVPISVTAETVTAIARAINADVAEALRLAGHDPDNYRFLLEGAGHESVDDHKEWFANLPREEREEVLAELQKLHLDTELKRRRAG